MRPIEWVLIILGPLIILLIILLLIWVIWRAGTPISPTGPTGSTGSTGPTGPTGTNRERLIREASANNRKILPEVNPMTVSDIVTTGCHLFILTHNHEIIFENNGYKHIHLTEGNIRNILAIEDNLMLVDNQGRLWKLDSDLWDEDWEFTLVHDVNSKGRIQWATTTLDQKYLWVTFAPVPGQIFGGMLFDSEFNMMAETNNRQIRIYGTTRDHHVTLDESNHTLRLLDGYIYSNVGSAILDCNNDVTTLPVEDTPPQGPLAGMRIVFGEIYILISPNSPTMQRYASMNNQAQMPFETEHLMVCNKRA